MIKRPENLIFVPVYLNLNRKLFYGLEIDLEHINKYNRSQYSVSDVTKYVLDELSFKKLVPSGERQFDNESCDYYEILFNRENKTLKLVFCICSDKPRIIGVITLYQIGNEHEPL